MAANECFDNEQIFSFDSNGALARTKSRYDRSSSVLMSAKSGVKHLQQKIIAIGQDTDVQKGEFLDSNLASILWSTGNVMVEIMARIRDDEMVALHDIDGSNLPLLGTNEMNTSLEYETKLQGLRPFNQRISLPSARDNLFENDSRRHPRNSFGHKRKLSKQKNLCKDNNAHPFQSPKIKKKNEFHHFTQTS